MNGRTGVERFLPFCSFAPLRFNSCPPALKAERSSVPFAGRGGGGGTPALLFLAAYFVPILCNFVVALPLRLRTSAGNAFRLHAPGVQRLVDVPRGTRAD